MSLFAREPSVPDLEDEVTDEFDLGQVEVPTTPANTRARALYDRDLHELVGKLIAHVLKEAKRQKALRAEVRVLRLELRRFTRRQTVQLGGAVALIEVAQQLWERFGH